MQKQQKKSNAEQIFRAGFIIGLITKSTKRKWELQNRKGLPMTEESKAEWEQAFIDIEESIEEMDLREEQNNPNAKYLRMKQQSLF